MTIHEDGGRGPHLDEERAVRERYSEAAQQRVDELCCPVEYDPRFLEVIPDEIIARDYGCGDPSRHVRTGEAVLDLGCGGGKACFIAAQIVGPTGRVVGVDFNDEMLALGRSHQEAVGDRLGYHNVALQKARIQDLRLDLEALDRRLASQPVTSSGEFDELQEWIEDQRRSAPLVDSTSIDVVISNCVMNLVRHDQKPVLFDELHRVLVDTGRAVISDIVSDQEVPETMRADADLWSGCISGALREDRFLEAFARAGFDRIRVVGRDESPWKTVEGIEFRSITVEATKGTPDGGSCCGSGGTRAVPQPA